MDWYKIFWYLFVGFFVGYTYAHHIVANECEKLGSFYVGKKVYHCSKIELKDKRNEK